MSLANSAFRLSMDSQAALEAYKWPYSYRILIKDRFQLFSRSSLKARQCVSQRKIPRQPVKNVWVTADRRGCRAQGRNGANCRWTSSLGHLYVRLCERGKLKCFYLIFGCSNVEFSAIITWTFVCEASTSKTSLSWVIECYVLMWNRACVLLYNWLVEFEGPP